MSRAKAALVLAFALAAALRIHNAWVAPPLSGFDGPYHAAYVGSIVWDGRFPLPRGFTNHPPLYYALAAAAWKVAAPFADVHGQLFAMRLVNVAAGLAAALAVAACARRIAPQSERVAGYAAVLALFLPMHVGPSSVLGNQMLSDALAAAAAALLLGALAQADASRARRAALVAGVVAGLGALAKLSVLLVAAVGAAFLAFDGLRRFGPRLRALSASIAFALAVVAVASPHFVRSIAFANAPPEPMSDIWTGLDRSQGRGSRPWRDYVDFDLSSLAHPGTAEPEAQRAVWPNAFASSWFDVFGAVVDVHHPRAQLGARVLFAFGALFSAAAAFGALRSVRGVARRDLAADPEPASAPAPLAVAFLLALALATLASFVAFTRAVPTHGALKGTYLGPALAAFCTFAALGLDAIARRSAPALRAVDGALATFAVCVCALLAQGWLAPMRVNPADFVMRDFADPPSRRVYEYFVGRPAPTGPNPLLAPRVTPRD